MYQSIFFSGTWYQPPKMSMSWWFPPQWCAAFPLYFFVYLSDLLYCGFFLLLRYHVIQNSILLDLLLASYLEPSLRNSFTFKTWANDSFISSCDILHCLLPHVPHKWYLPHAIVGRSRSISTFAVVVPFANTNKPRLTQSCTFTMSCLIVLGMHQNFYFLSILQVVYLPGTSLTPLLNPLLFVYVYPDGL